MAIGDETIRSFTPPPAGDPLVGTIVDSYRIESVVGAGAMGIVYRGVHTVIGKAVAIKVLKADFADDEEMVERLVREAQTVNAIRHPGIVGVFGFGTLERTKQPYLMMDLLEGEPLDVFMAREAPLTLRAVSGMLDELLSALAAAHKVGVIHRDLKPGNCFLESQPEGGRKLKLLDFGLARQADRAGGSIRPTNPNTLIGTPAFMAPEQVTGGKLTPATDLYAVGGIAYQMLTGHLPHEAPSAIEVLTQKMKYDPVRPRQWVPSMDEEIDAWVMGLLEREPEKRERDAEVVRRQLRHLSQPRTQAINTSPPPKAVTTGVVPKREWSQARTILVEPGKTPEVSTDAHLSPWASDPRSVEPTAPPTTSPFAKLDTQPQFGTRAATADFDTAPDSTPPSPTLLMTPSRGLPKVVLASPEDSTLPPRNVRQAPEEESFTKVNRGLLVALGVAIAALIIGLIFLVHLL